MKFFVQSFYICNVYIYGHFGVTVQKQSSFLIQNEIADT